MGTRADQARRQVAAAREALAGEVAGMERSLRDAVDLPARARRDPVRFAGLAAGAAFVAVGGPRRVLRRVGTVLRGGRPPAPRSLLPEEIERAVEDLGPDAGAVRARLEHEFAAYLDANRQDRARTDATRTLLRAFDTIVGTVSKRAARVLTERLFAAGTERRDR
ncbi:MAG: hypothetical protein A2X23_12225 [Chloroflexi bacterium GWC2_73_18]|nr:MAG: hypothetical protein A2X23_12225 [Chloroflexi bacterium GWC2_73_18]